MTASGQLSRPPPGSYLAASGQSPAAAVTSMTLDTYSHLWPSAEDRTRSAAGALLDEALNTIKDEDSPLTLMHGAQ